MKIGTARLKRIYMCSTSDYAINSHMAESEQKSISDSLAELIVSLNLAMQSKAKARTGVGPI